MELYRPHARIVYGLHKLSASGSPWRSFAQCYCVPSSAPGQWNRIDASLRTNSNGDKKLQTRNTAYSEYEMKPGESRGEIYSIPGLDSLSWNYSDSDSSSLARDLSLIMKSIKPTSSMEGLCSALESIATLTENPQYHISVKSNFDREIYSVWSTCALPKMHNISANEISQLITNLMRIKKTLTEEEAEEIYESLGGMDQFDIETLVAIGKVTAEHRIDFPAISFSMWLLAVEKYARTKPMDARQALSVLFVLNHFRDKLSDDEIPRIFRGKFVDNLPNATFDNLVDFISIVHSLNLDISYALFGIWMDEVVLKVKEGNPVNLSQCVKAVSGLGRAFDQRCYSAWLKESTARIEQFDSHSILVSMRAIPEMGKRFSPDIAEKWYAQVEKLAPHFNLSELHVCAQIFQYFRVSFTHPVKRALQERAAELEVVDNVQIQESFFSDPFEVTPNSKKVFSTSEQHRENYMKPWEERFQGAAKLGETLRENNKPGTDGKYGSDGFRKNKAGQFRRAGTKTREFF